MAMLVVSRARSESRPTTALRLASSGRARRGANAASSSHGAQAPADASKLPTVVGVDLGLQGYLVMRVTKILPRETTPGGDGPWQQQYAQIWAAAESQAYEAALKRRYKVDIQPAAMAVVAGSAAGTGGAAASGAASGAAR